MDIAQCSFLHTIIMCVPAEVQGEPCLYLSILHDSSHVIPSFLPLLLLKATYNPLHAIVIHPYSVVYLGVGN